MAGERQGDELAADTPGGPPQTSSSDVRHFPGSRKVDGRCAVDARFGELALTTVGRNKGRGARGRTKNVAHCGTAGHKPNGPVSCAAHGGERGAGRPAAALVAPDAGSGGQGDEAREFLPLSCAAPYQEGRGGPSPCGGQTEWGSGLYQSGSHVREKSARVRETGRTTAM